jgi:hypothetical protein
MAVRVFTPPARSSVARTVLAVVLPLVVAVPLGALLLVATGLRPASYTIASGALVVRSGDLFAGTRTVKLADVTDAHVVGLRNGRRVMGTAMPGFCAGRFSYAEIGDVWQVTTCAGRGVLLRSHTEELPIVLTPPDPDGFLAALRAGTEQAITLPPPDAGPTRVVVLGVGGLGMLTTLALSALLLFGPARMRYLVGDGELVVETMFGRQRWALAGARAKGHTPTRLWRLAGVAAPGYRTGRFQENGEATRVYATQIDRVLLFEAGTDRVLLSPEDRVGMLRALEAEGASVVHHV